MKAKIKICGITTLEDARLAVELGADYLGFNFYRKSPRYIDPVRAADLIADVRSKTIPVGLFVNATREEIAAVVANGSLSWVQLHGDEDDAFCQAVKVLGVKVIKALRVCSRKDIENLTRLSADILLLDAFHPDVYGGSGETFDWGWLKPLESSHIMLAGGITPDNIAQALAVGTFAVDLCSGVEARPGVKDPEKLKRLFAAVKGFYGSE